MNVVKWTEPEADHSPESVTHFAHLLTDPGDRSKAYVCGPSIAGIAGSNPTKDIDVGLLCCVFSGLSDELIIRPEESYRVCLL
jgi:hypothetical protein